MRRALVLVAAALLIPGCASGTASYPAAVAEGLQSRVLAVTEAAADGDLETALTRLDELADSAKAALAQGAVTESRHDDIVSAIQLVRADLELLIEKAADGDGGGDGKSENGSGEESATDTEGEEAGDSGTGGDDSGNGDSGNGDSGEDSSGEGSSGNDDSGSGNGNSGNGNSGSGGGDGAEDDTEEPAEEPAEEEPAEEEPAEEDPAEEEPKPTATTKATSPPANG